MHGLGNDFIVIEALNNKFQVPAEKISQLADRHFGIGFDQLLLVEPPLSDAMDFSYRIFNADGIEVEQCGNGARCSGGSRGVKNVRSARSFHIFWPDFSTP